ncbi:hypothetical protein BCR33DRAFT_711380 [Rhizoclosmatium globosum]|uniref:Uncharacterized protein n=1 Tax=Rhizoclosmatium globosum TaxID=329046 RepID=A0A1Y2D344_9FUNG|nr:hypothetical protein BCR33DRAFT_711380 [Rhizoclosmatium globosum]|eukprot:ORY52975.1 hypothetical protein BCR33DRAFT_711380 [Rhizoclosmatium globosum]
MPTDPTFLDKPIRSLTLRYLVVMPILSVVLLLLGLIDADQDWRSPQTYWTYFDTLIMCLFSAYGYNALKRMIPESLAVFTHCVFWRSVCTTSDSSSSTTMPNNGTSPNSAVLTLAKPDSDTVQPAISVSLLILIFLFASVLYAIGVLLNWMVVSRILVPLIDYSIQCRKVLSVDWEDIREQVALSISQPSATASVSRAEGDELIVCINEDLKRN